MITKFNNPNCLNNQLQFICCGLMFTCSKCFFTYHFIQSVKIVIVIKQRYEIYSKNFSNFVSNLKVLNYFILIVFLCVNVLTFLFLEVNRLSF